MTLIIKYIATVYTQTGEIKHVSTAPGGDLPEEGIIEGSDPEVEIIHVPSAEFHYVDLLTMHNEYYRKDNAWVHKGTPPNEYFEWDIEAEQWTLNSESLFRAVREERTRRLYQCDWTQAPDAPITPEDVELWKLYRQSLRDFPSSCTNINSLEGLVWPTPPE